MARSSTMGKKPEQATHGFAPEKNIGADRKIVGERQVLVDGLNASLARLAGRAEARRDSPANMIWPASGL